MSETEIKDTEEIEEIGEKIITIQTHDKRFHADDVGAVFILNNYYNIKNIKVQLIRSRDLSFDSDILVDVGGVYDPDHQKYDHHQEDCREVFSTGCKIPLSSIGMVWKHFGRELLDMYIKSCNFSNDEEHINNLHTEIYFKIIREIDANDNGIASVEGGKRNFWENLHLSSVIASINTSDTDNEKEQMEAFKKAMNLFGIVFEIKFVETVRKYFSRIQDFEVVNKFINNAGEEEYLIIDQKVQTVYRCLNELDPRYRFKFLIFCDNDNVTIKTRSYKNSRFSPIVPLVPYARMCKYLGDEKDNLIFVHKNLFIAQTKDLETACKMVGFSLSERNRGRITSYLPDISLKGKNRDWIILGGLGLVGAAAVGSQLLYGSE